MCVCDTHTVNAFVLRKGGINIETYEKIILNGINTSNCYSFLENPNKL